MLAVDTNILIRFLTQDEPDQSRRATAILTSQAVWVATTVILECEWILRRGYRYSREQIADALRRIAGAPSVALEDAPRLAEALEAFEAGMDLADALHLQAAKDCEAFVTFDKAMIRIAATLKTLPVIEA